MEKQIKDIVSRLAKLEEAVFGKREKFIKQTDKKFVGPQGGVMLLISKDFFRDKKRSLAEIKENLAKEGYHYSLQAVQTALIRLSKLNGPLTSLKEGKKVYAERK